MEKLEIQNGYKKHVNAITQLLSNFESEGQIVVDGERNSIKNFYLGDNKINVKKFQTPNFFNALVYRYFRKSKARRSFEYASYLISRNIDTPFPIAYYENRPILGLKESFYVSEHVDYDFDFRDLIHQPWFPNRKEILRQFTDFTFKLHENNIDFLDHSPGNTLIVDNGNNQYGFYLIDLNRMRFRSLDLEQRLNNFRRLWLSKTMVKIIAERYAELSETSFEKVYVTLLERSRRFQKAKNAKKLRRLGRRLKFRS